MATVGGSSSTNSNPQRIASLKTFLASDEPISIVPIFNYNTKISEFLLTQRNVGPLVAGEATAVPLWLGLYLRKRNLCRIVPPHWLSVQHLKRVLAHERNPNEDQFSQDLPFRYMEISRSILQTIGAGRSAAHASGGGGGGLGNEEIPQVEIIRVLLEDISGVRMDKIRRNVHNISADVMGSSMERPMPVVDVTGIGSAELAAVKPFLERAFEDHLKLVRSGTDVAAPQRSGRDQEQQQEQETGGGRSNSSVRTLRRRSYSGSTRSNDQEQQEDEMGEEDEEDQDLIEPTADDDSNNDVSRLRVRRYR